MTERTFIIVVAFGVAVLILVPLLAISTGFGIGSEGELVGQIKEVRKVNPVICPRHATAEISLGHIKDGTGSYSTEDKLIQIPDDRVEEFKRYAVTGEIVTAQTATWRLALCVPDTHVR